MKRIGIECEQLEGKRFGVGHTLAQLLDEFTRIPGIEKRYLFVLYFKSEIPPDAFLAHPVFERKIVTGGIIPRSFNVLYHIVLPVRYFTDSLDGFFFPSYMLPAFFIGNAVVVLTNDVYWEAHHGTLPFRYRISYRMFCWWAAKRAQKIMTISRFSADELKGFYHIPQSRILVNPWGLEPIFKDLPRTDAYYKRVSALKKRYGIANDFFLSVGQAFPRRGVREAMEAFGTIARTHPTMQYLVACGDKYNPPVLAQTAKRINAETGREAIVYTTEYLNRADFPYLFSETKALIYISTKEALGLPPLEALACGRPAIIADTPLAHEILGDEGFFVKDLKDIREIAGKMNVVLTDAGKIGHVLEAQKPRLNYYNWHAHALRLLEAFDEVTARS